MLATILISVSCNDESQPTGVVAETWQQSMEKLYETYLQAMADKDVDAFMSCIWKSPDAVLVLEHGIIVRGWDNIYGGVAGMMAQHENLSLVIDNLSQFQFGDFVFSVGQATWTRTGGPEADYSFQEVWTDVAKKVDGEWVVVMNHPHWVGDVGDPWPPWIP